MLSGVVISLGERESLRLAARVCFWRLRYSEHSGAKLGGLRFCLLHTPCFPLLADYPKGIQRLLHFRNAVSAMWPGALATGASFRRACFGIELHSQLLALHYRLRPADHFRVPTSFRPSAVPERTCPNSPRWVTSSKALPQP